MKPLLITIPHSGERIPPEADWLAGLPELLLMSDVDRYVDRLYQPILDELKIPHVKTPWHRYAADLNRLPADVDADSVLGHKNPSGSFANGFHWVKTMEGAKLMSSPISVAQHKQIVARCYDFFHADILRIYKSLADQGFKETFHIDAHSMPSMGTASHRDPGERRADVVVSDFNGKSCSVFFKDLVIESFKKQGLRVAYNWPYVGGRLTQTYGRPDEKKQVLQIELNRDLYMDEITKQWIDSKAPELQKKIGASIRDIYAQLPQN